MEHPYNVIQGQRVPVKAWTKGVPVEEDAIKQLTNITTLPFVFRHVAAMPDVHYGIGATVGSVVATKGAIIPAAVGVDIGCGMVAVKTDLKASDLPDNLDDMRAAIEAAVPHGRTNDGKAGDRGAWGNTPESALMMFQHGDGGPDETLEARYKRILAKHPTIEPRNHPTKHMGTLGTGNHFIEVCLDEEQSVWIMLHSGSRGVGNKIGTYFIEKAKEEMRKYHIEKFLPDQDLAYLPEHTVLFDDYVEAVHWAQDFAKVNRAHMMGAVMVAIELTLGRGVGMVEKAINCHHNYVERENHFGENVLVTRKGAVRAREGDLGIIPGSMGARSYIVRGKGEKQSFCSCSHGAGRKMSRTQAKKIYSLDDHIKAVEGVNCRRDLEVIDETPMAYKDIEDVMRAQADLVEIVHTLKQVVCIKG